jgi:putative flavoprotein involved in K+ transport
MKLVGKADYYKDGVLHIAPDLAQNIAAGDASYFSILEEADAYVARNGLDLPEDPDARKVDSNPDCVINPILEIDVAKAGIRSIVWATGYALDFGWLKIGKFDERGWPIHERGVTPTPGLYFLGLPWLSRRASPFIWGVWHDADYLADHIATRK